MTRPHKEHWEIHHGPSRGEAHITPRKTGKGPTRILGSFKGDGALERARLAAQAPAMARDLLELLQADGDALSLECGVEEWKRRTTQRLRDAGVIE